MDPSPATPTPPATNAPWWKTAAGWKGALPWWFRHAKRAAGVDYDQGVATDAERARLAGEGRAVTSRRMQDFLAWRRSMLSVAAPLLLVYAVLSTVDLVKHIADADQKGTWGEHLPLRQLLWVIETAADWVLFFFSFVALTRWDSLPRSHRGLRRGWIVGFGVPVLLFLVPLGALVELGDTTEIEAQAANAPEVMRDVASVGIGLLEFLKAVPVAVAVFFGLMRAGFASMRLSPESVVGGLAVSMGSLLLTLFLLPFLVLLIQGSGGNVLALIGALLLCAGLLRYVVAVGTLATPRPASAFATEVGPVRRSAVLLVDAGLAFLVLFAFVKAFFGGAHILGFGEHAFVGPYLLLKVVFEFGGRSIVTAVLLCDVLAAVTARAWIGSKSLHAGPIGPLLEERVAELASVGVTELRKPRPSDPAGSAPQTPSGAEQR